MASKFPKKAISKWTRFSRIEQIFILYCFLILAGFIFAPFIQQANLDGTQIKTYYMRQTPDMYTSNILIIFLMLLLILWNISFRFKRFINVLIGFKENDALINFFLLFIIGVYFLVSKDLFSLIKNNITGSINITSYFYIMYVLIIIGLVYNLFLAVKVSSSKKKPQIVNLTQEKEEQKAEEKFKSLFE